MDLTAARERMIEGQLLARGIGEPRVLEAFRRVARHEFLPAELEERAYEDRPLAIGYGQTISQPYMVACMTEALLPAEGERVLEIGTGSGYQTAILCEIGAEVYTVERRAELAVPAWRRLEAMGYAVRGRVGDGSIGWPEEAPFGGIVVTAGAPVVPRRLVGQLRPGGGRLVIPVGDVDQQELLLLRSEGGEITSKRICSCHFVKLIGEEGWREP